jgi:hypothetical protein
MHADSRKRALQKSAAPSLKMLLLVVVMIAGLGEAFYVPGKAVFSFFFNNFFRLFLFFLFVFGKDGDEGESTKKKGEVRNGKKAG